MSDLGSSSVSPDTSTATNKKQQHGPPTLRPLAPKPPQPTPAPQPLAIRTATPLPQSSALGKRRSPAACPVCYKPGCQLPTHTAYSDLSRSSSGESSRKASTSASQIDPAFTSSYAFQLAQQYGRTGTSASMANPTYDLPLDADMNTPEMHRLFHSWFVVESQASFRIPRPPEIIGDLLWNPFFLPAMQDPLLCLSVLAAAAAGPSRRSGQQARNVISLTLLGQAIQQMRERMNSDPTHVSDTTIVAAVLLWLVNIFMEDDAAMTSHANSIYAIVKSRGGLNKLGLVGAVASAIRWTDIIHSFVIPVACHYLDPPDPGPPLSLPPARYGAYWAQQDAAASLTIDPSVTKACQDICRLLEQLELAENEGISATAYVQMVDRLYLSYTQGSVLRARNHKRGDVNECVLLAAGLIQFHCFSDLNNFTSVAKSNIGRLVHAIKATGGPSFWQKDLELLIWLLFVVVMIPVDMADKSWCLPFLGRVIATRFGREGKLDSDWRQEVRICLHHFVWCDVRLEQLFMEACRAVRRELSHNKGDNDDDDDDSEDEDEDDDDEEDE